MNLEWVRVNTDLCIDSDNATDCEFGVYRKIVDENLLDMCPDDYICCQAYSKMLDLTRISPKPFNQTCQDEELRGEEIHLKTLVDFGFDDIGKIFKYNCILGNLYPCSFALSLHTYCNGDINTLLLYLVNSIRKRNNKTFNVDAFIEYVKSNHQFWTAAGIFKYSDFADMTVFAYQMLDDFKRNDITYIENPRINSLLLEIFYGFCIWCIMKKYMVNVGFATMIRDASVTFSRNEGKTLKGVNL